MVARRVTVTVTVRLAASACATSLTVSVPANPPWTVAGRIATACPKSLDPYHIVNYYRMGQDFLDIQYLVGYYRVKQSK